MNKLSTTYIYALVDPRTNQIRYIGKTDQPKIRILHHVKPNLLSRKSKKNSWLKNLLNNGLKPIMRIIEEVPVDKWQEREIFWISHFKKLGYNITNMTEGGEGGIPNDEVKIKISNKLKGRKLPPEQIMKMSISQMGRIVSDVTRKKISEARNGHEVSLETRSKISRANEGKKQSVEAIEKIRRSSRGRRPKLAYSKYWGVTRDNRRNKWIANLTINKNKTYFLGSYKNEIYAAKAHDIAAIVYWGKDALLNFPGDINLNTFQGFSFEEIVFTLRHTAEQSNVTTVLHNRKTYRGVTFSRHRKTWSATIQFEFKNRSLGAYRSPEEAAEAYDRIAILLFGKNAILNNPKLLDHDIPNVSYSSNDIKQAIIDVKKESRQRILCSYKKKKSKSSQYWGVVYSKQRKHWQVHLLLDNRRYIYIGMEDDEIQAARLYDIVALAVFGNNAKTNFPDEINSIDIDKINQYYKNNGIKNLIQCLRLEGINAFYKK